MTEERREIGVMELELALQRERAFQAKVARMKLQAQFTFSEVLKPLKMQCSRPSLSSNTTLIPGTALSGVKRPLPPGISRCDLPSKQQPSYGSSTSKNSQDKFFCKICQVPCSAAVCYEQHLKGQKHRAMLTNLKFGKKQIAEGASQRQRCEVCNIWCMDHNSFESHLGGQKHHYELQKQKTKNAYGQSKYIKRL